MPKDRSAMVVVVGTSHTIQMGNDAVSEEFKTFLESLCRTHKILAVVEEMSAEALAEGNCSASVPMRVANSLRVEHRFCDPDRSERTKLGICQENDVRAQAFLAGWSETEISSRILAENAKREQYWLNHLRALNQWPTLFVCGADHVASFCALLERKGVAACGGAEDWVSNHAV